MKLQISTGYKRHAAKPTDDALCIRSILKTNYPWVRTLSDYAEQSATRYGGPPVPAPVSAPHYLREDGPQSSPEPPSRRAPPPTVQIERPRRTAVPIDRFDPGASVRPTLSIQGELQGSPEVPREASHSEHRGTPPPLRLRGSLTASLRGRLKENPEGRLNQHGPSPVPTTSSRATTKKHGTTQTGLRQTRES